MRLCSIAIATNPAAPAVVVIMDDGNGVRIYSSGDTQPYVSLRSTRYCTYTRIEIRIRIRTTALRAA